MAFKYIQYTEAEKEELVKMLRALQKAVKELMTPSKQDLQKTRFATKGCKTVTLMGVHEVADKLKEQFPDQTKRLILLVLMGNDAMFPASDLETVRIPNIKALGLGLGPLKDELIGEIEQDYPAICTCQILADKGFNTTNYTIRVHFGKDMEKVQADMAKKAAQAAEKKRVQQQRKALEAAQAQKEQEEAQAAQAQKEQEEAQAAQAQKEQEEAQAVEAVAMKHSNAICAKVGLQLLQLALEAKKAAGQALTVSKEEATQLARVAKQTIGCLADDLVGGVLHLQALVDCGSV